MHNSPKQPIKSSKKAFSQNRARQKRSFLSNQLILSHKQINPPRQLPILFSNHIPCVVRAEPDLHHIVGVFPGWVVLSGLGEFGHSGHERKSRLEVLEFKLAVKLVVMGLPRVHYLEPPCW